MELEYASQFILKLTDRCNIACTYCYMFEFDKHAGPSHPAFMSEELLDLVLERIVEQVRFTGNHNVFLELHGGEPLLLGKWRFAQYMEKVQRALGAFNLTVAMQTNALLLDHEWLDLLLRYHVVFGVSLDGPPPVHDLFRITRAGSGTGQKVLDAIRLIRSHEAASLFQGALSVINPASSGAEQYRFFAELELPAFNFLLPDGNHAAKPFHLSGSSSRSVDRFLIEAFDAWYDDDDPAIRIRLFNSLILELLGQKQSLDYFGGILGGIAVIETNGDLIPHDVLRICSSSAGSAPANIYRDEIRSLRDERFFPWLEAAPVCQSCELFPVCRGGYAPHRFDGVSFGNPDIHCAELKSFIRHVAGRVLPAIDKERWSEYPLLTGIALGNEVTCA